MNAALFALNLFVLNELRPWCDGSCAEAICNPTISTATNRFTSIGYQYDQNGNLTVDGEGRQFTYDAENHQTEVKDSENNVLGEYRYDGEGRRVKKISGTEETSSSIMRDGCLLRSTRPRWR